jgi:hypothetical protein
LLINGQSAPPPPISYDDILRALRDIRQYPPDFAQQFAKDLASTLDEPGTLWSPAILLWVAMRSDAHEERIRQFLGFTEAQMTKALARERSILAEPE